MQETVFISLPLEDLKTAISEAVKAEFQKQSTNQEQPPQTEYITRQETARFLGVSLPTLNEWSKAGIVTAYRIGTRVRYKKAEVEGSLTRVKSLKYNKPA